MINPTQARHSTLLHISDLHIHQPAWQLWQYANKRCLGAANWWLRRRKQFPMSRQHDLVAYLQTLAWDYLLCSGDITQLSLEVEFRKAREILAPLLDLGLKKGLESGQKRELESGQKSGHQRVIMMAGNHDRYLPNCHHFDQYFGLYAPARGGLLWRRLSRYWWLLAWDSAMPAPCFRAYGAVPSQLLAESTRLLATLGPQERVIVANHYPLFFPLTHRYKKHRDLQNQQEVSQWILQHTPPIALYLHGHIHQNWQWQPPQARGKLTVINSAASSQLLSPSERGSSSFHKIVLDDDQYRVEPMYLPS